MKSSLALFTVVKRPGIRERLVDLLQLLMFFTIPIHSFVPVVYRDVGSLLGDGIVPISCSVKNLNLRIKN